jgi:hypothetical protein
VPAERMGTCRLVEDQWLIVRRQTKRKLVVNVYRVVPVESEASIGGPAYRVKKAGTNSEYHVIQTPAGARCECKDFLTRRDGKDKYGCKHIRTLRAVGKLPPVE